MPPKKLPPPPLPLGIFTSSSTTGYQADRTTPSKVIDPHVFLPISDQPNQIASSLDSWNRSVQALHSRFLSVTNPDEQSGCHGFVYLHHQPTWLSQSHLVLETPHEVLVDLPEDWLKEKEKIMKIDQELTRIKLEKPFLNITQVIWAPLNEGEIILEKYLNDLIIMQNGGNETKIKNKIKGCFHLIQSRSNINATKFINSLKLLGKLGLHVEFLVESNLDRSATSVLDDVLEYVSAVRLDQDPEHQTKFILCQMGMPEKISSQSTIPSSVSCSTILSRLFSLSLFSNFEIKLTSLPINPDEELNYKLSERFKLKYLNQTEKMNNNIIVDQPGEEDNTTVSINSQIDKFKLDHSESAWREMKKRIKFYLEPILEAFGDHRIIYATGFPYFDSLNQNSLSPPIPVSDPVIRYQCNFELFRECLTEFGLRDSALDNVFGLNAQRCYGI